MADGHGGQGMHVQLLPEPYEILAYASIMSHQRAARFPCRGDNLWGGQGNFGEVWGNLWIALKIRSERTSREVARELPGKF